MDENTLYWLFTTAPQAIAALVGITFTGMIFMVGIIDNRVKIDSTLYDIAETAKLAIYKNLKVASVFSLFTIIYDLIMVSAVKYVIKGTPFSEVLYYGFWVFNVSSFIIVFKYVFQVVGPNYFDSVVKNMSKIYKGGNVDKNTFLNNFIAYEKLVRSIGGTNSRNVFVSLQEINNMLVSDKIITKQEAMQLSEARKIRNLIVHGDDIVKVDKVYNDNLLRITEKIKKAV